MRVTLAVPGRFHGFDLARSLDGAEIRLLTTYPAFAVRRFGVEPAATAPWLEGWRRVCQRLGRDPDPLLAPAFARFTARRMGRPQVLVGWSDFMLEAIAPAHDRGAVVVLERGSSHVLHQDRVLRAAGAAGVPAFAIQRELAEYAAADAIVVPTGFARRTFADNGVDPAKVFVNPYGVALDAFAPVPRPPRKPRILFVGRVGIRKGVPDLVEAARRLGDAAEVVLVGPMESGFMPEGPVILRGPVPQSALPAEYAAADMFVLPSLEEGLPLVLLQAMASGLPVVATPETGIEDLLTEAGEALVVPSRDPAALAQALAALAGDPGRRAAMGAAARARVETGCSWADYGTRALGVYRRMVEGRG